MTPDLFQLAHSALAASTHAEGQVAVWYCASARLAFTEAQEKLRTLERILVARERELSAAAGPKQLASGKVA